MLNDREIRLRRGEHRIVPSGGSGPDPSGAEALAWLGRELWWEATIARLGDTPALTPPLPRPTSHRSCDHKMQGREPAVRTNHRLCWPQRARASATGRRRRPESDAIRPIS